MCVCVIAKKTTRGKQRDHPLYFKCIIHCSTSHSQVFLISINKTYNLSWSNYCLPFPAMHFIISSHSSHLLLLLYPPQCLCRFQAVHFSSLHFIPNPPLPPSRPRLSPPQSHSVSVSHCLTPLFSERLISDIFVFIHIHLFCPHVPRITRRLAHFFSHTSLPTTC